MLNYIPFVFSVVLGPKRPSFLRTAGPALARRDIAVSEWKRRKVDKRKFESWLACCWAVAYAENFHGGVQSVAFGGHLHLVCAVCDVTIRRQIHVCKPTFSRNLL